MPDPKKQKKRVWEIDFHESDPNRRKTNLHNAKKYAIAGLREKKRLSRPAGTLLLCAWEEKRAVRGSGKGKPARETRKEISFGSGREKECRQTRRKPKCSHVSQKNRRLYAKTGLQREKVLCRPVLILCTTSANND